MSEASSSRAAARFSEALELFAGRVFPPSAELPPEPPSAWVGLELSQLAGRQLSARGRELLRGVLPAAQRLVLEPRGGGVSPLAMARVAGAALDVADLPVAMPARAAIEALVRALEARGAGPGDAVVSPEPLGRRAPVEVEPAPLFEDVDRLAAETALRYFPLGSTDFERLASELSAAAREVSRHLAAGDLEGWRCTGALAGPQLRPLAASWREPETTARQLLPSGAEISSRELDGVAIAGAARLLDVAMQRSPGLLLPFLANGSTRLVVLEAEGRAVAACLRLLVEEGAGPHLYLEPLGPIADGAERRAFELAAIKHAVAKARRLGLPISLGLELELAARLTGARPKRAMQRFWLEPSAGVLEWSKTLGSRSDWVARSRELSRPVERCLLVPGVP